MNRKKFSCRPIAAAAMMLILLPAAAQAQFLKKLTQGLEKVNKGLEKVEQALQPDKKVEQAQQSGQKETNAPQKKSESNSQLPADANQAAVDESGWKNAEPAYLTPYFTADTKFMVTDPSAFDISDVHDGVFAIKRGMAFEFWKVTGEKLFDADWKYAGGIGSDFPIFSGGVAAARRATPNASGKTPICLLYKDGRVKELDPSWETVTQFVDGVALATAKINYTEYVFYIDVAGNKLYSNLKIDKANKNPMRPLRDGMRAFYGKGANQTGGYKWGFIDAKGNVKIAPKYREVSDYANGYAWASTNDPKTGVSYKELIDLTGKAIFKLDDCNTHTSDVQDGVFCVEERDRSVYYDLSGKELASYRSCNGFSKGYAFIAKSYEHAFVIDRSFNIVKRMPYDYCNAVDVDDMRPVFEPFGLATVHSGSTVIDPKGNIVLVGYDDHHGTYIRGFKQFTESGYAKATGFMIKGKSCMAFVKPSGEIAWLFSDSRSFPVDQPPLPVHPPKLPKPPIPVPPFPPIPVVTDQPAIGPKSVEKVSFTVKVVAAPAEGGSVSVSPTGKFAYAEYATINAVPNKEWAVRSIQTDVEGLTAPKAGKPFPVVADQTVIVNFVEKEKEEAPDNFGSYLGHVTFDDEWRIPVYAEINQKGAEENPYGTDNYGFVTLMFDPATRYVDKKGEFAVNMFAVPLKIVGIQKDPADQSTQWLVVDGGSFATHNLKVNTASNPLFGMVLSGMIAFDGFSSVNTQPRRYRIEMLDRDPESGEFRFGVLQTYSAKVGRWVSGDDPVLTETTSGFFGSYSDNGYPPDTFAGARMTKTQKRNDILWYPPESWSKDQSAHQQLIESMGAAYRNSKSDYEQMFDQ